jgi:hypothetical protein
VRAWRDRKHPELGDRELAAQWERFTDHHIGNGNTRADWVRTFYTWLTGPFYKRLTPSDKPAHSLPVVERQEPPPPPKPGELEAAIAESRTQRAEHRGGAYHLAAGGAAS